MISTIDLERASVITNAIHNYFRAWEDAELAILSWNFHIMDEDVDDKIIQQFYDKMEDALQRLKDTHETLKDLTMVNREAVQIVFEET